MLYFSQAILKIRFAVLSETTYNLLLNVLSETTYNLLLNVLSKITLSLLSVKKKENFVKKTNFLGRFVLLNCTVLEVV